jgi:hypothetical protein
MKKLIILSITLLTLSACSQLGLSSAEPAEPVDLSGIESQLDALDKKIEEQNKKLDVRLDVIEAKLDKPVAKPKPDAKPKPENIQPVATVEAQEEKDCSQGNGTAQNPLVSNTEENPCKYRLEITKQGVIFPFINENIIVDEIHYNRGNITIEFVSSIDADLIFTYEGVGYYSVPSMPIMGANKGESINTDFLPMDCKCPGYMAIHEGIAESFKIILQVGYVADPDLLGYASEVTFLGQ